LQVESVTGQPPACVEASEVAVRVLGPAAHASLPATIRWKYRVALRGRLGRIPL
jgi:hypothetical protein